MLPVTGLAGGRGSSQPQFCSAPKPSRVALRTTQVFCHFCPQTTSRCCPLPLTPAGTARQVAISHPYLALCKSFLAGFSVPAFVSVHCVLTELLENSSRKATCLVSRLHEKLPQGFPVQPN